MNIFDEMLKNSIKISKKLWEIFPPGEGNLIYEILYNCIEEISDKRRKYEWNSSLIKYIAYRVIDDISPRNSRSTEPRYNIVSCFRSYIFNDCIQENI